MLIKYKYKTNKVSNKNDDNSINVNANNKPNKSIEEDWNKGHKKKKN